VTGKERGYAVQPRKLVELQRGELKSWVAEHRRLANDRVAREVGRFGGRESGINLHDDLRSTDETCHQMHLSKALLENRAEYKSLFC